MVSGPQFPQLCNESPSSKSPPQFMELIAASWTAKDQNYVPEWQAPQRAGTVMGSACPACSSEKHQGEKGVAKCSLDQLEVFAPTLTLSVSYSPASPRWCLRSRGFRSRESSTGRVPVEVRCRPGALIGLCPPSGCAQQSCSLTVTFVMV